MKNNLINGYIPKGESCFASDFCLFKFNACNGNGCPVCNGKIHHIDFSCGAARLFALFDKEDNKQH